MIFLVEIILITLIKIASETISDIIWEQQTVNHSEQFIATFRIRCQDLCIQECFSHIEESRRCRLYRNVKEVFEMEW